jgi:thermolysin
MVRSTRLFWIAVVAVLICRPGPVAGQAPAVGRQVIAAATSLTSRTLDAAALSELRTWNQNVSGWVRSGELQRLSLEADRLVRGRSIERFAQYYRGVPVFGGSLVRQINGFQQAETILGTFYPDISLIVRAGIPAARAGDLLRAAGQGTLGPGGSVTLTILPTSAGYRLTWTAPVHSADDGLIRRIFIDATNGAVVFSYDDTWTQTPTAAVGLGTGVMSDRLKVSAERLGSQYLTVDLLRPGGNTTYDMKASHTRANQILGGTAPAQSDIAADSDNVWADPAVAAAHAYAGFTYDYYRQRFGRTGLDDRSPPLKIRLVVNPARPEDWANPPSGSSSLFYNNAAYYGNGYVAFGVGSTSSSGVIWRNLAGAIDVVAHELSHGVTAYSSNLIYLNESGALNEAFSDMMSAAVEFSIQPFGSGPGKSDWIEGEDVTVSGLGLRSFSAPNTLSGNPDHYSLKFTGTSDNGGVHINSNIVNHMYYLAIAGGTNRVSGLAVQGVGFENREQIERVIYQAFTHLPSSATFSVARAATIQAARDLYGAGSKADLAITQAWNAVGVQ